MSTYGTPLLRAINALDAPVLRELAGRVAVGKLLTENPSHAALCPRAKGLLPGGMLRTNTQYTVSQ